MKENKDIFDHLKPRKTPIPEASYFEALANSVIESKKENTSSAQEKTKIIPLYKRTSVWIGAVAAIFIAGLLILNFNKTTEVDSDPLLALNEVSSEDVFNYIDENIEDFETDLIVEAMDTSEIDEMSFVKIDTTLIEPNPEQKNVVGEQPISFDELTPQDILDYFYEEGIDSEDLEDEDSFI